MYAAMLIILYDHLHIVSVVFLFVVLKISYSYVLDSESPFMGATVFLLKPRRDKQQYALPANGVKPAFTPSCERCSSCIQETKTQ